MLFQIVTLLWIVARPVAASSVEGDLKPLKILTLDGGGLQGLATLLILDDLLKAIAANPDNRYGKPRPCDVFDMIGGIGVGGWLALLLGRFHLDIATCIQVYVEIVRSVVPRSTKEKCYLRWHNASYNQDRLQDKIRQLTDKYATGKHMIYENREGPRCQFAFAAAAVKDSPDYQIFRTYKTHRCTEGLLGPDPESCDIPEAFASTSAAKYLFSSFKAPNSNVKFSDTGFPYPHNITNLAIDEAQSIRGKSTPIALVINIGPGVPTSKDVRALAGQLAALARVFSFGTDAALRGKALYQATDAGKTASTAGTPAPKTSAAPDLVQIGTSRSSLDGHARSASWFRRPSAVETVKGLREAIHERLKREYPPGEGTPSNNTPLYFGLGPEKAPKKTAVNDVFEAEITYKETLKWLDSKKPKLDEISLHYQAEHWNQAKVGVVEVT